MKRILVFLISLGALAGFALAETDYVSQGELRAIRKGLKTLENPVVDTLTIDEGGLSDSSVVSADIKDSTITASDLAADSVEASEIAAGAVGTSEIAADSVGASELIEGEAYTFTHNMTLTNGSIWRVLKVTENYTEVWVPRTYGAVTNGQILTGLARYATVSPAANVTCAIANATYKGQLTSVLNITATTNVVTFTDGSNLKLSGNAALGADDFMELYSADGTNWWQIADEAN